LSAEYSSQNDNSNEMNHYELAAYNKYHSGGDTLPFPTPREINLQLQ